MKKRVYSAVIEIVTQRKIGGGYDHRLRVEDADIAILEQIYLGQIAFSKEGMRKAEEDHEAQFEKFPSADEMITTITITSDVAHNYRRGNVKEGES